MLFSHDTERSLACVVDLVNSSASRTPAGSDEEQLPDLGSLAAFVVRHDVSEVGEITAQDLRGVHALRDAVAAVFDATDERSAAELSRGVANDAGDVIHKRWSLRRRGGACRE